MSDQEEFTARARRYAAARKKSARLREQLDAVRAEIAELKPDLNQRIVELGRQGLTPPDVWALADGTYTRERIRQLFKAAGITVSDPTEGAP